MKVTYITYSIIVGRINESASGEFIYGLCRRVAYSMDSNPIYTLRPILERKVHLIFALENFHHE